MNKKPLKPMVMSNVDPAADEILFHNDRGSWNVSRALRDCFAGKHKIWKLDLNEVYEANKAVEVDEAKVASIAKAMERGDGFEPAIGVIEDGAIWIIDGHHRLRAERSLGNTDSSCWIIEADAAKPYIVWYNGQRKPPYKTH